MLAPQEIQAFQTAGKVVVPDTLTNGTRDDGDIEAALFWLKHNKALTSLTIDVSRPAVQRQLLSFVQHQVQNSDSPSLAIYFSESIDFQLSDDEGGHAFKMQMLQQLRLAAQRQEEFRLRYQDFRGATAKMAFFTVKKEDCASCNSKVIFDDFGIDLGESGGGDDALQFLRSVVYKPEFNFPKSFFKVANCTIEDVANMELISLVLEQQETASSLELLDIDFKDKAYQALIERILLSAKNKLNNTKKLTFDLGFDRAYPRVITGVVLQAILTLSHHVKLTNFLYDNSPGSLQILLPYMPGDVETVVELFVHPDQTAVKEFAPHLMSTAVLNGRSLWIGNRGFSQESQYIVFPFYADHHLVVPVWDIDKAEIVYTDQAPYLQHVRELVACLINPDPMLHPQAIADIFQRASVEAIQLAACAGDEGLSLIILAALFEQMGNAFFAQVAYSFLPQVNCPLEIVQWIKLVKSVPQQPVIQPQQGVNVGLFAQQQPPPLLPPAPNGLQQVQFFP